MKRDSRRFLLRLPAMVRSDAWWEYKLCPTLGVIYGTALLGDAPVSAYWLTLLGILLALIAGAFWVNVLNDWMDIGADLSVGKTNRMANKPRWVAVCLVVVPAMIGWAVVLSMRSGAVVLTLYAVNCLVFVFYSVPPFRLKSRGAMGIVADALGVHTLPALFGIAAYSAAADMVLDPVWWAAVCVWSLAYGLRSILWHQLVDYREDRRAGERTFVCIVGRRMSRRLGERVVFPLELLALAGLLWMCARPLPLVLLTLDLLLARREQTHSHGPTVVFTPRPNRRILLNDFNVALLPLALLASSAIKHPLDWLVFAAHLALFPQRWLTWIHEFYPVTRTQLRKLIP